MCGFKAVKAISLAEKPDKEVKLSWKDRTVSGKVMSVKTHVFTCTWHPPPPEDSWGILHCHGDLSLADTKEAHICVCDHSSVFKHLFLPL